MITEWIERASNEMAQSAWPSSSQLFLHVHFANWIEAVLINSYKAATYYLNLMSQEIIIIICFQ